MMTITTTRRKDDDEDYEEYDDDEDNKSEHVGNIVALRGYTCLWTLPG